MNTLKALNHLGTPLRAAGLSLCILGIGAIPAVHAQQQQQGGSVAFSGDGFGTFEPSFSAVLGTVSASFTEVQRDAVGQAAGSGMYSMIWLDGFSTFPGLPTEQLQGFVQNGGTLVVQSPGFGGNPLNQFPKGAEIEQATYTGWPGNGEAQIRIVDSLHPLMAGLTNPGLTWKNPDAFSASGHTSGSIGGFHGLVDNGTSSQWVTLVQDVGSGHLVYTYQDISRRLTGEPNGAQAVDFLRNIVAYSMPVPEPSTAAMALLGALLIRPVLRVGRRR